MESSERSRVARNYDFVIARLVEGLQPPPESRTDLDAELRRRLTMLLDRSDLAPDAGLLPGIAFDLCRTAHARSAAWRRNPASNASTAAPQALHEAVIRLPEPFRDMLLWRFWEGASLDEISERTGGDPGRAHSRLAAALNALRDQLSHGVDRARGIQRPSIIDHRPVGSDADDSSDEPDEVEGSIV